MEAEGDWVEVSREIIENAAQVAGDSSTFAQVLRDADDWIGPVAFFYDGKSIFMQKILPEAQGES